MGAMISQVHNEAERKKRIRQNVRGDNFVQHALNLALHSHASDLNFNYDNSPTHYLYLIAE